MEQMIEGDKPPNAKDGFSGLKSPKWPEDILPKIDRTLADKGGELYKEHCQECHRRRRVSRTSAAVPAYFNYTRNEWRTNEIGQRSASSRTSRSSMSAPTPRRRRT